MLPDFEVTVILSVLEDGPQTVAALKTELFNFYGNLEAADRAPFHLMRLEKSGMVRCSGLPPVYVLTEAGTQRIRDYLYAIDRFSEAYRRPSVDNVDKAQL